MTQRLSQWVALVALLSLATGVHGHGFLAIPKSRNYLHNSYYCPHCLNGGGLGATRGDTRGIKYPGSIHGMCGDPAVGPLDHEAGGKYATGDITGTYEEGGLIHLAAAMSTYHKGAIRYRICRYAPGTPDQERAALTEDCLNQNWIKQADITGAQVPNAKWYFLGNASDGGYYPPQLFHHTFRLPDGLTCDGVNYKCVLQFHWIAGNSCNDPAIPKGFKLTYLPPCGVVNSWPEEFWNCADIKILPKGSSGIDQPDPSWPAFDPGLFQTASGYEWPDQDLPDFDVLPPPPQWPVVPLSPPPPTQASPSPSPPSPSPPLRSPPPPPKPVKSPPPPSPVVAPIQPNSGTNNQNPAPPPPKKKKKKKHPPPPPPKKRRKKKPPPPPRKLMEQNVVYFTAGKKK